MTDIIKKLGITPVVCYSRGGKEWIFDMDEVRGKETVFNEILEALIEIIDLDFVHEKHFSDKYISIIEKACHPKSWEEIKELLE